jgi:DNA-binding NtrC family response regulator
MNDDNAKRPPRILVVDDEADLRELLELTLVGMGLDVDCAASLGQAKALARTNNYQLCLTDMRLPDGLGLALVEDFAQRLRKCRKCSGRAEGRGFRLFVQANRLGILESLGALSSV